LQRTRKDHKKTSLTQESPYDVDPHIPGTWRPGENEGLMIFVKQRIKNRKTQRQKSPSGRPVSFTLTESNIPERAKDCVFGQMAQLTHQFMREKDFTRRKVWKKKTKDGLQKIKGVGRRTNIRRENEDDTHPEDGPGVIDYGNPCSSGLNWHMEVTKSLSNHPNTKK
jgi:hypothetical protein